MSKYYTWDRVISGCDDPVGNLWDDYVAREADRYMAAHPCDVCGTDIWMPGDSDVCAECASKGASNERV